MWVSVDGAEPQVGGFHELGVPMMGGPIRRIIGVYIGAPFFMKTAKF